MKKLRNLHNRIYVSGIHETIWSFSRDITVNDEICTNATLWARLGFIRVLRFGSNMKLTRLLPTKARGIKLHLARRYSKKFRNWSCLADQLSARASLKFIPRAFRAFERHHVARGILRDFHVFGEQFSCKLLPLAQG